MGSRRHVLAAIYNANLERYHWNSANEGEATQVLVKREPMAGFLFDAGIIEILDIEDQWDCNNREENIELAINEENVELAINEAAIQDIKPN